MSLVKSVVYNRNFTYYITPTYIVEEVFLLDESDDELLTEASENIKTEDSP